MDKEQQATNGTNQAREKTEVALKFPNKIKLLGQPWALLLINERQQIYLDGLH